MNRINLIILLDKLEDIIDNAPEIPLTGRVLLDSDELLELIEKIRNAVPEEVKRAEMVSTEKDRVISEGQQRAERIIAQAKEQAARMLKESEIYRQAQQEAKQILAEAHQRAQELIKGSEEYAFNVLSELHETLDKTIKVVARGQEELQKDNRNTAAAAAE
ncbi:MAG: ATPase [Candidatus Wallacebacter cryptica]|nr:ATPase [Bacillota bacterium]